MVGRGTGRRALRWVLVGTLVASLPATAHGREDDELGPLSPRLQAILAAHESGARERMTQLVDAPQGEPWLEAHELCLRGHTAAAGRFARASTRVELRPLKEYVATLSRRPPSVPVWRRYRAARALAIQERWFDLLEDLHDDPVERTEQTAPLVYLLHIECVAHLALDQHEEAIKDGFAGGEIGSALGWWEGAQRALRAAFRAAMAAYDLEEMLRIKRKLLSVHEFSGNRRDAGRSLADIGSILARDARYSDALRHYERALEQYGADLQPETRMHVLTQCGLAHWHMGHYAEAQSLNLRALAMAQRPDFDDPEVHLMALEHLGLISTHIGEFEDAEHYLQEGLRVAAEIEDEAWTAELSGNLAILRFEQERYGEALETFQRLGDYYDRVNEPRLRLVVRAHIAYCRQREGRLDEALQIFESVRREQERLGDKDGLMLTYAEMAHFYRKAGELQRAMHFQHQALKLARESEAVEQEVKALAGLAAVQVARGEYEEALAAAHKAASSLSYLFDRLPPSQAASARRRTAKVYQVGLEAARHAGSLDDACFFIEGGRAGALLTTLQKRDLVRVGQVGSEILAELAGARSAEAAAQRAYRRILEASNTLEAVRAARASYEQARAAHKRAAGRVLLEASIEADLRHPPPASRAQIQATLKPYEALVLYERAGENVVALVLTRSKASLVDLGSTEAVRKACKALHLGPEHKSDAPDVDSVRRLVAEPLGLPTSIRRVMLSPVDCLSYQSPALLFPDREVVLVPSGTIYVHMRERTFLPATPVLALGDPVYGAPPSNWEPTSAVRSGRLVPLPGTRVEAERVGDTVLLGPDASETKLREVLAADKRWRCVHLACHGVMDEARPSYSALALTPSDEDDGMLTTQDVYQLDVRADLVVLSACSSGRGKLVEAEGIVGLVRAFMSAGASRVLVSTWKVNDQASRELMVKFHELWNAKDPAKRLGAAAALRAAQMHVRDYAKNHGGEHPEWAHPHYWAAWQLWD